MIVWWFRRKLIISTYKIDFDSLDWKSPAEAVRFKIIRRNENQVRLIEFTPELSHPEWCITGHAGYVLQGTLEVKFENETLIFSEGDGVLIPDGEKHKHIPKAIIDSVQLLSIEKTELNPDN